MRVCTSFSFSFLFSTFPSLYPIERQLFLQFHPNLYYYTIPNWPLVCFACLLLAFDLTCGIYYYVLLIDYY